DFGALLPIVVLDSGVVRAALVDVDDLGKAVVLDGAREEAPRRTTIAFGGQQEVDGVPLLINRAIPIPVLAANLDVRLVQSPAFADRTDAAFALPFAKGFLQHRNQLDDPAVNGGMIDEQAALLHHLFEIAQTQRVGDIPPHAHQHDVQWKRFRWITLLTLFMTVRSLRAAKQPRCNMTTGIARTGRFVWRNKRGNCDERLIATEPEIVSVRLSPASAKAVRRYAFDRDITVQELLRRDSASTCSRHTVADGHTARRRDGPTR